MWKDIVNSVTENIRPKENFACTSCPFAFWIAGQVEYSAWGDSEFDALNGMNKSSEDALTCYCKQKHSETYNSTIRTKQSLDVAQNNKRQIISYVNIIRCPTRDSAINQILSGE